MRYLSVCSGIEAATCAWHNLGWVPFAFSEIEPFPSAVLAHHYPDVPNFGDMTKFKEWPDADVDVLVGGTPCQSFSVAGLRKGLADPRGNLMLTYLAIADRYQPEWIVWENVPGVLSSGSGRDFGTFLGALGQIGYGWAYRVLDAQFFGVPQRRRRVFVVGHLGDWRRAAAVLFERHSLQGHPPPSREKRQDTTSATGTRTFECGGIGSYSSSSSSPLLKSGADLGHGCEALVGSWWDGGQTAQTLDAVLQKGQTMPEKNRFPAVLVPDTAHSLRAEGFDASEDGTGRGTPLVTVGALACNTGPNGHDAGNFACNQAVDAGHVLPISIRTAQTSSNGCGINDEGTSYTLDGAQGQAIAFDCKASGQNGFGVGEIAGTMRSMGHAGSHQNVGGHQAVAFTASEQSNSFAWEKDYYPALDCQVPNDTSNIQKGVRQGMQVRRLTPRECERLQGFPDDYTLIPVRGKPAADGPRYKALGNSMAVPVMRWIGERIAMVDAIPLASEIAA